MKKQRRQYLHPITGAKLPSVTEIMKDNLGWSSSSLMAWANKIGREGKTLAAGRDDSAKLGQCTHALLEHFLRDEDEPYVDDEDFGLAMIYKATPNALRVKRELEKHQLAAVYIEEQLVDSVRGYGGTLDLILRDKNAKLWMADLKTGNGVYSESVVQLGAYTWLHELHHPLEPVEGGIIIHAPFGDSLRLLPVTRQQLMQGATVFGALLMAEMARKELKDVFK